MIGRKRLSDFTMSAIAISYTVLQPTCMLLLPSYFFKSLQRYTHDIAGCTTFCFGKKYLSDPL